jgi:hypothetical protein
MKKHARKPDRGPISRRAFVGGAVGVGVVAAGGSAALVGAAVPPDSARSGRSGGARSPLNFGRMFPELPPFAEATDDVRAALRELGRPGGIMDANDDLAAGPVALIVDANLNVVNRKNTSHTRRDDLRGSVRRPGAGGHGAAGLAADLEDRAAAPGVGGGEFVRHLTVIVQEPTAWTSKN